MSGHSKWSNIKRKKGITDKIKGATFAKLSRLITLAVLEGGGMADPINNFRLRFAIDKARSLNMPKENITRAVEKGSGPNKEVLKEVVYEAFAPHGVNLIIVATTDNSNRTFAEIRLVLERNKGKMGGQGTVAYNFQKCGVVVFEDSKESEVLLFAEAMSAYDIEKEENSFTVYIPFENLGKVKDYSNSLVPVLVESEYKPKTTVQLAIKEQNEVVELIEKLEEMDDIQNVYSNLAFETI